MIEGRVRLRETDDGDTFLEAVVPLTVRGFADQAMRIEAILDTGFGAALSLRPNDINTLGLVTSGQVISVLADGSERIATVYTAVVEWNGFERLVSALASDSEPLLGMALLEGSNLFVEVSDGGVAEITSQI